MLNDLTSEKVRLPDGHWLIGYNGDTAFVGSNSMARLRKIWCDDLLSMDACMADGQVYISMPDGSTIWQRELLPKLKLTSLDVPFSDEPMKLGIISFEFHVDGAEKFFELRSLQGCLELQARGDHYSKWIMRAWGRWKSESLEWNVPASHWIPSAKGAGGQLQGDPRACQHTYFASVLAVLWVVVRWATTLKSSSASAAVGNLEDVFNATRCDFAMFECVFVSVWIAVLCVC